MCSGLNLPFGSHHSAAIASNLATSAGSTVLVCAASSTSLRVWLLSAQALPALYRANMDQRSGQKRAVEFLYPPIDPFDQRVHRHGRWPPHLCRAMRQPARHPGHRVARRPGRRLQPGDAALFRPRASTASSCSTSAAAAGRAPMPASRPTPPGTWSRISRRSAATLGIDRLIVFGGSWGATLALIYAHHPSRPGRAPGAARRVPDDAGRA